MSELKLMQRIEDCFLRGAPEPDSSPDLDIYRVIFEGFKRLRVEAMTAELRDLDHLQKKTVDGIGDGDLLKGFKRLQVEAFREEAETWEAELAVDGVERRAGSRGQKAESGEQRGRDTRREAKRRSLTRRLAIAASILLPVIGLTWWMLQQQTVDYGQLADRYYVEPVLDNFRKNGVAGSNAEISSAMDRGDYPQAIQLIEKRLSDAETAEQNELLVYLGHCLYQSGRYDDVDQAVKTVISLRDVRYAEEADWLLALSILKSATSNAKRIAPFRAIANNNDHGFQDEAKAVLRQLE